MSSWLSQAFGFFFKIDKRDRLKFFFLTMSYCVIVAGYTIVKELKDSIFIKVVGADYLPWAKIISMVALVPAILFYSYLVDKLRRYQLLYLYSLIYGVLGILFCYFLSDPTIGIANTDASPYRLLGWLFYFFIEGYSPFVVSVFWAFANSVTSPQEAKKNYGLMVSGSKLGGMASAGFAWYFLGLSVFHGMPLSMVLKHQVLMILSFSLLLIVPLLIFWLIKKVPGNELHGYEAVYQLEKKRQPEQEKEAAKRTWGGLSMLVKQPYVMGIFGMILFYEIVNVVLGYQRLIGANEASCDLAGLNCILFQQIFFVHFVGFLISFFGTTALLRRFGERRALLLIPIATGILLLFFMFGAVFAGSLSKAYIIAFAFIGIRAINYAISYPVRESLYIPTVKEIKFKSKSWIDAFGTKVAKGIGSQFNIIARVLAKNFGSYAFELAHSIFFSVIIGLWFVVAYLLGKRYAKAVAHDEVIGETKKVH